MWRASVDNAMEGYETYLSSSISKRPSQRAPGGKSHEAKEGVLKIAPALMPSLPQTLQCFIEAKYKEVRMDDLLFEGMCRFEPGNAEGNKAVRELLEGIRKGTGSVVQNLQEWIVAFHHLNSMNEVTRSDLRRYPQALRGMFRDFSLETRMSILMGKERNPLDYEVTEEEILGLHAYLMSKAINEKEEVKCFSTKFREEDNTRESGRFNKRREKGDNICWEFAKNGTCKFGEKCKFKHQKEKKEVKKPCRYVMNGKECKFGDKCRFSHKAFKGEETKTAAVATTEEEEDMAIAFANNDSEQIMSNDIGLWGFRSNCC